MRIFKNRGDIYVPKGKYKTSKEAKILIAVLVVFVILSALFVYYVAYNNNFSITEFFTPDSLQVEEDDDSSSTETLPEVSGIKNFLFVLSNEDTDQMYVTALIEVDLDNIAYKVCAISTETTVGNYQIDEIYESSGAGGVASNLASYLGITIDYYIDLDTDAYEDVFDAFGDVNYTLLEDVKYKDTTQYGYNVKISAGEQTIGGTNAMKLLRYYVDNGEDYTAINNFMLECLHQQVNEENYEDREDLFSTFIQNCTTNITIKNFTEATNNLKVLSASSTGVNVYSVAVEYDGNTLTEQSISDIGAYF